MFKSTHTYRDNYMYFKEAAEDKVAKEKQQTEQTKKEREDFYRALNNYRVQAELKNSEISKLSESVLDEHLETVFEAVYISALEKASPISESEIELAQSLVKNYIKEHGGAASIMKKNSGKTYLLDFMFECVQNAHDIDMRAFLEADEDEKAMEEAKKKVEEDKKADNSDADENESGEDIKLGDATGDGKDDSEEEEVKEDPKEDEDKEESKDDDKKEDEDKNLVDDLEDDSEESTSEDEAPEEKSGEEKEETDSEESESDDDTDEGFKAALDDEDTLPDEGAEEEESSTDDKGEFKDSKEDMFEKLENDETVDSAVSIIAKRIADAEAEFIKRNAEDKAKIEKIADKIDERIQAVNQSDKPEEVKDQEKDELKIEATRSINEVKSNRLHIVFEEMVANNANYIMKDKALMESYSNEDGKVDFTRILEATRVQYGFLEFLNTVQLEKVDKQYILDVVNERK